MSGSGARKPIVGALGAFSREQLEAELARRGYHYREALEVVSAGTPIVVAGGAVVSIWPSMKWFADEILSGRWRPENQEASRG